MVVRGSGPAHGPLNAASFAQCRDQAIGELSTAIRIRPIRLNSDAGSQYTAVRFGETLMLEGMRPSIGSVGDAYDKEYSSHRTPLG